MVRRYGVVVMASLCTLPLAAAHAQPPLFAVEKMGGAAALRFPVVAPPPRPTLPPQAVPAAVPVRAHGSPFVHFPVPRGPHHTHTAPAPALPAPSMAPAPSQAVSATAALQAARSEGAASVDNRLDGNVTGFYFLDSQAALAPGGARGAQRKGEPIPYCK